MPVIDTGLVMAYLLNEPSADRALRVILGDEVHAPDLLRIETANALINAVRKDRITPGQVAPRYDLVQRLPVQFHDSTPLIARALDLSMRYQRRPYDGVFVTLAEYLDQELITLDAALVRGLAGTSLAKRVRLLVG